MKRLDAGKFLTINSFPTLKGRELRAEKNKVNNVINYAIGRELICDNDDEIDTVAFLRWASSKKRGGVLVWPWLNACVNLPRKPISGSGTLITIAQSVVPGEIEECQDHLVKAWRENADLQKRVNELLKENEELKVKRQKRIENGKTAAARQWRK